MKTALIIGGTGLVGKELTALLLNDNRYSQIISLVRKPLERINEKLVQLPFNFDKPDPSVIVANELFCCLGTTIKAAGNKQSFYKVDHDYIINIARLAYLNGIKKMALVSSIGAEKDSRIFYNNTKGITEDDAMQIGFESLFILRPSILLGHRSESRPGEAIGKFLMVNLAFILPKNYRPVKGKQVARAMIEMMNSGKVGTHILESASIAAL